MVILTWTITGLVLFMVITWVLYTVGVQRLPNDVRPKVMVFDRTGCPVGESEAPDYHLNAGEE